MAEEKPKSGRQLGETGETVRRNIRWIRNAEGLSGADLSERVTTLGRPIPLLGIQRIEAGTRRVDVDDLMAIAAALRVSPASLLMPLHKDASDADREAPVPKVGDDVGAKDLVPMTGWGKPVPARLLWAWLTAAEPLVHGTILSLYNHGWPAWERDAFRERMAEVQRERNERNRAAHAVDVPEADVPEEVLDMLRDKLEGNDGND